MTIEINKIRKQIGQRWFKLALEWSKNHPATKRERQAIVKAMHPAHGGNAKNIGGLSRSLEIVDDTAIAIMRSRKKRTHIMATVNGRNILFKNTGPYVDQSLTVQQRLIARIKFFAGDAVECNTKQPERDDLIINVSNDPGKLGMEVDYETVWPYSGSQSRTPAKEYTRIVTVPYRYISRVHKRGLSVVGGLVTLDAAIVDSTAKGVTIYASVWLQPGRGFEYHTVRGFIAISDDGENFHGKTVKSVVCGIRNRQMSDGEKEERSRRYFETRLKNIAKNSNGTAYRMCHAEKLGFCDYGIRSWCNRVNIDPDASATMKEIIDGYRQVPLTEVRRFILHYGRKTK